MQEQKPTMNQPPESPNDGTATGYDETTEAARRLLGMSADEWEAHQNGRYPGTQEIVEARHGLLHDIQEFAAPDAPAARLFERFDPGISGDHDTGRRLDAYRRVCEQHFNFRTGPDGKPRERQEVKELLEAPREEVGEDLWDTTFAVCGELGLVGNSELQDNETVTCIGVLGATPTAIANRTRYAKEQIVRHGAAVGSFDYLVAEGEVDFAKKEAELQLGVDVGREISREDRPDGVIVTFAPVDIGGQQVPVRILTAKTPEGSELGRATTYDTMRLWGDVSGAQPEDNMVAVTTDLYTGFQQGNSSEIITWKTGNHIRLIGHSAEWAGNKRCANQLLQELKAKVDSDYRLYEKMIETGMAPPLPERYEVNIDALYEPIPNMDGLRKGKAGYTGEPIDTEHPLHDEPLVDINEYDLSGQAYYSRPNPATGEAVQGTPKKLFVRRSIAQQLRSINETLRSPAITQFFGGEVELYLEDAFRDIALQRKLHDEDIPNLIRRQQPDLTEAEIAQRVREMIAVPSNNPQGPSPHQAGAFDIVLRYRQADRGYVPGAKVQMGHNDGETSERLYPDQFERHEPVTQEDAAAQHNRRGFYAIMTGKAFGIETGFVPNPTEWFHWSRGDQLWARVNQLQGKPEQPYYSIARLPEPENEAGSQA